MILGFRTETQTVTAPAEAVRFELVTAAINLDAIVVTGTAGAVERRAVGTAIATINAAEQIELAPTPDVTNLINGRAPGVVVTPGTGMVGSGPTIRIRGASSFSLNTQPLIYVDGVRLDNGVGTGISIQGFGSGVVNRLNDINPEDIESIEIIKGPAAATLYGTEAANGVIQILTKKGRSGAPEWGLTVRQGANWFHDAENRIEANWGLDPASGQPFQNNLFESERALGNTIFNTGHLQSYGATVRGGTDDVRYYIGTDLEFNEGIEPDQPSVAAQHTEQPDPVDRSEVRPHGVHRVQPGQNQSGVRGGLRRPHVGDDVRPAGQPRHALSRIHQLPAGNHLRGVRLLAGQ